MSKKHLFALTAALTLTPAPAFAADGSGLSMLETIGIFVLAPLSIYGVIWLLWSIPAWRREATAPATGERWSPTPGLK